MRDKDETLGGDKPDIDITSEAVYSVEKWLEHAFGRPMDPKEQASVSGQDVEEPSESELEASDLDNSVEDKTPPFALKLRSFLLNSRSFRYLRRDFMLMSLPLEIKHVLTSVPKEHIQLSIQQDFSFSNRLKAYIEDRTQVRWNWWPFEQRKRMLQGGESRMYWQCVRLVW
jgi:hypothetical protein